MIRLPRCCKYLLGAAILASAGGQTRVDLGTQGKNIDFSGVSTKPFQAGTVLPSTCSVGQTYFKTDASAGQNFYGCTASDVWTVQTPGESPNYSAAFTSQTSVVIPGTAHGYTTTNLIIECYDTGTSIVIPSSVAIDSSTYDVTIGFSSPRSGRCLVNGGGAGGSGGPGSSGGSGSGPVSLSGDVGGTTSATVVTRIQGKPVAATAATDGQALTWDGTSGQWEPRTIQTGTSSVSNLGVTFTNPTVLTIGAGCSATAPCNVRFGNAVWNIQAPATAAISGGTGTAYIYVDQSGTLNVGHNLTVTCSTGCQAQPGVTGFPANVIPIATWTASNGTWSAQGSDWRASLSTNVLNAGQGIVVVTTGGASTVAVDTTVVPTYLKGSATLDFASMANGVCAGDLTVSVPGALSGDAVAPGWPATLPQGVMGTMFVSAADTVTVRLCNLSGSTVNPASATYSATTVRSF